MDHDEHNRLWELIQAAHAGGPKAQAAWDELAKRLLPWLLRLANAALTIKSRYDPEDIVQESLKAALQSWSGTNFTCPATFLAWLQTVVRNTANRLSRDAIRNKRDVRREVRLDDPSLGSAGASVIDLPATMKDPSQPLEQAELKQQLQACLARLEPRQQQALNLFYCEGLPNSPAAERMGMTYAAFSSLLHRAKQNLKSCLKSKGVDP